MMPETRHAALPATHVARFRASQIAETVRLRLDMGGRVLHSLDAVDGARLRVGSSLLTSLSRSMDVTG
jgi:hypothetical protein